jgi:toxin ParE1/3/4
MSSPDYQLFRSAKADEDLDDILQYTLERWGDAQAIVYGKLLERAFEDILRTPSIGHARPDLSPEKRVMVAGSHLIVYSVSGTIIYVSRILHGRMNIKGHV